MALLDINKEIRRAVDTGKVFFGWRSTERNILKGNGKLVILSINAPQAVAEKAKYLVVVSGLQTFDFKGTASELGSVCGKPFVVSIMLVKDEGKSRIMELPQQQTEKEKPHKRTRSH